MDRNEIKKYILTQITYDFITPNYILSKWYEPEDIETVKSLQPEIPTLVIDEAGKKFRLKLRI